MIYICHRLNVGPKKYNKPNRHPIEDNFQGIWDYNNDWGNCSYSDGKCFQKGTGICLDIDRKQVVPDDYCAVRNKTVWRPCEEKDCPYWAYSAWDCIHPIDSYCTEKRSAECRSAFGDLLDDKDCNDASKKVTRRLCREESCPDWSYGPWQSCCNGLQTRTANCMGILGNPLDENRCNAIAENDERRCPSCPKWHYSNWGKCSFSNNRCTRQRTIVEFPQASKVKLNVDGCSLPDLEQPCDENDCYHCNTTVW